MMKLYAGNLNFRMDEAAIEKLFRTYGEVRSVKLITDRDTGQSRGFAFVEMPNQQEAMRAMQELSGKEVDGRALVVNEARPPQKR